MCNYFRLLTHTHTSSECCCAFFGVFRIFNDLEFALLNPEHLNTLWIECEFSTPFGFCHSSNYSIGWSACLKHDQYVWTEHIDTLYQNHHSKRYQFHSRFTVKAIKHNHSNIVVLSLCGHRKLVWFRRYISLKMPNLFIRWSWSLVALAMES